MFCHSHGLIIIIIIIMAFPIAAVISAAASIASSIFAHSSQKSTNKETMRFQQMQQQKQNDFNASEAQKARDYQSKMSNTEISRRSSDLLSAGFNPAFATGTGGASIGSVPQASASSVSAPNLRAPEAPIDPLTISQIHLNNSQAKKNEAEAENTEKSTDWMDVLNQSTIDYQGSYVSVNGSLTSLNEQQKEFVAQQIKESQQQVENLRKQVEEMDSRITMNDIDAFWKSGKYAAEIDSLKASAHLSDSQAKEIVYLMTSKRALLNAQAASAAADVPLKSAQTGLAKAQNTEHFWLGRMAYWDAGSSKISFQLYDKFGEFDKYFDYTTRGIETACKVGDLFLGWKKGLSQIKQGERSLDQRDRDLSLRDRDFELRNIEHNDRQFNADRSFRQHERDFSEKMREQQREFNAKWHQREKFMDRWRKSRYD